ncbi:hypothetical protein [Streptomyces sp. NPDC058011]
MTVAQGERVQDDRRLQEVVAHSIAMLATWASTTSWRPALCAVVIA